jgi:hypothetical protein
MIPRAMTKTYEAVNRKDIEEHEMRVHLLREAQAGDLAALRLLHQRYHLRLPLVELRLGLDSASPRGLEEARSPRRADLQQVIGTSRRKPLRRLLARGGRARGGTP